MPNRKRRCIVPVDGFSVEGHQGPESQATLCHSDEGRQPVRARRAVGELERPSTGEWIRIFAIVTTDANDMVAEIRERMPLVIAPGDYERWLSDDPDPHDLTAPGPSQAQCGNVADFKAEVNKPENDDPSIVEPIEASAA